MDLSIIIPVWNEAAKIGKDIDTIGTFSESYHASVELIIADDGSDDSTTQIAEEITVSHSLSKKVIRCKEHRGKGYAVRKGIAESTGNVVMFMDSGQNVPVNLIDVGIKLLDKQACDILLGSRYLPDSIIHKKLVWYRQISSFLFRKFVRWYFQLPDSISDTQCGFKIFKGDIARELFNTCQSDGFIFDIEIILSAIRKNYHICEFPIEWTCDRDSRLSLIQSLYPILHDLRKLQQR